VEAVARHALKLLGARQTNVKLHWNLFHRTVGATLMTGFTDEIRSFLRSQRILEDWVCDASMVGPRRYKRKMKAQGKLFAIVRDPCYRGHYIRSHAGHCMQCDTSRIAYVLRYYRREAYIYVVGSRRHRLLKIGWSETPYDRADHLNIIGYGEIYDLGAAVLLRLSGSWESRAFFPFAAFLVRDSAGLGA
jgi:hypothetical protein